MTVDANALTLGQYAVMSNDPLVQSIADSLLKAGTVLTDIPLINKQSLIANGVRWEGNLPTVNWEKINGEPIVTSGTPTPFQEQVYLIRNAIDVDKRLVQDVNQIGNPRSNQLAAYLRSVAYDFNDKFINNSHTTGDSDAPVGLKARIDNYATYGVVSENKIDAASTMTTGMSAANANAFFEKLDLLLWSVDAPEGDGVVLYMNDVMKRRISFAARLMAGSGGFSTASDQFGRSVEMYKNARLADIGRKADQTTKIILNTEANTGAAGSSTYTSIYACNFGVEHLFGWQFEPLGALDLGLLNNGVTYRTVVDWAVGLMNNHTRSIARAYDINLG